MIDLQTLHLLALQQGLGVRRHGHVDDDCYDLVISGDGTVIGRALPRDQVAAVLLGD